MITSTLQVKKLKKWTWTVKTNKVLVLHQSDELKVIASQNKILDFFTANKISSENKKSKVIKTYPLWASFDDDFSENFSGKVSSLSLANACVQNKGFHLFFVVSDSQGKVFQADMEIIRFMNDVSDFDFELPELKCRVFRISEAHFNQSNRSYFLTDSKWVKL